MCSEEQIARCELVRNALQWNQSTKNFVKCDSQFVNKNEKYISIINIFKRHGCKTCCRIVTITTSFGCIFQAFQTTWHLKQRTIYRSSTRWTTRVSGWPYEFEKKHLKNMPIAALLIIIRCDQVVWRTLQRTLIIRF